MTTISWRTTESIDTSDAYREFTMCFRGIHTFDRLEFANFEVDKKRIASQRQFRFKDLVYKDIQDYYDPKILTLGDLLADKQKWNHDFDEREIVTLVKFKLI